MRSSFRSQGLSNNSVNSVEPLVVNVEFGKGQYRAKLNCVSNFERVTAIPTGSRVQEVSKRRASILDDDIAWPSWKHEEKWWNRSLRNKKRSKVHFPSVSSVALVKPCLIDLEAQKWVTRAKTYSNTISFLTKVVKMDIDILGKKLRDILLGDATLSNPVSKNAGSILQITHENKQKKWLEFKADSLSDLGMMFKFVGGDQKYNYKEGTFQFTMGYTPSSKFLRFLYDRWYERTLDGKRVKNYRKMLSDYIVDMETFIVFFLDNGCIDKRDGYLKSFIFSTNFQDSDLLAKQLSNFKFAVRSYDKNGSKSHFTLGTKRAKERFQVLLREFCQKNNLVDVFSYKYELPISHAERLNDGGCDD